MTIKGDDSAEIGNDLYWDAVPIRATLDGIVYTLEPVTDGTYTTYGAPDDDWSEYPFQIYMSNYGDSGSTMMHIDTSEFESYEDIDITYSLKIEAIERDVTITGCFRSAVKAIVPFTNLVNGDAAGSVKTLDADTSRGEYAFAEGIETRADGQASHAEGLHTLAYGNYSHTEGRATSARGVSAHAEGTGTTAKHKSQHVFGEYNVADPSTQGSTSRGTYVEIVGNGTASNALSNARTLDWNGNEYLAGSLTLGSTTLTETDLQALLALLNA